MKDSALGDKHLKLEQLTDALLLGILPRGHDAAGMLAIGKDGRNVTLSKEDVPADTFIHFRKPLPKDCKTILLHTRLQTKGDAKNPLNNHPVQYKSCFAVHNGMIRNDDRLFKEHKLERRAEVDSEIIPAMIHACGFAGMKEALKELSGSMATAIVDPIEHPGELILARGDSSPLVWIETEKFWMWASLQSAMTEAWKHFYGTPPGYKKFHSMDEGYLMYIKDDEATTEKFKEIRSWSSDHSHVSWEGGYTPVHARSSENPVGFSRFLHEQNQRTERAVPPFCWECNKVMGIVTLRDAYQDKKTGNIIEWDYPVCLQCEKSLHLEDYSKKFTYRYAQPVKEFREMTEDHWKSQRQDQYTNLAPADEGGKADPDNEPVCPYCQYYEGTIEVDGQLTCRGCFNWLMKTKFSEWRDSKGKIRTLLPGQRIPSELQPHFKYCESCGNHDPVYLSAQDGFPICELCKQGEDKAQEYAESKEAPVLDSTSKALGLNSKKYCHSCDEFVERRKLHHTVWGPMCESCHNGYIGTAEDEYFDEEGEGVETGTQSDGSRYQVLEDGTHKWECKLTTCQFYKEGLRHWHKYRPDDQPEEPPRGWSPGMQLLEEGKKKGITACDFREESPVETWRRLEQEREEREGGKETSREFPPSEPVHFKTWDKLEGREQAIHKRACMEAGWELNVSSDFVNWVVFQCPISRLNEEPELLEQHQDAKRAYNDAHWVVEELVKGGRTDLIYDLPLNDDKVGSFLLWSSGKGAEDAKV